jgi:prepilin-type N-terminal cleavage/methylation domain-containing protein
MKRRDGFTLLEICMVVAIIVMVMLIAVPSVSGLFAEQRLRRTFESFNTLVRKAQARSVDERRTYMLAWRKEGIELVPMDLREGEDAPQPEHLALAKDEAYAIERPAAMVKDPPPTWTFWRSGVCEPAIISYKGPHGTWKVKYDALTAHGTFLEENVGS